MTKLQFLLLADLSLWLAIGLAIKATLQFAGPNP
jgi:hypothetical protein